MKIVGSVIRSGRRITCDLPYTLR